jgi:hypothetical protein
MKNSKTRIFLTIAVLIVVVWVVKGTFFQPAADDLKAGITERAKYRNENNTGPIQHIFAVSIKDSIWNELEIYGNYKPHHKGGVTKVYFFMEGSEMPDKLHPGEVNFDPAFNKYCVALYEKTAMGNVSLTKYPFR